MTTCLRSDWPPAAVGAVLLALACQQPSDTPAATCRGLPHGTLSTADLTLLIDSHLVAGGGVQAGHSPQCDSHPRARRAFEGASDAMLRLPPALRPTPLTVHYDPIAESGVPPVHLVEMHAATGALLVSAAAAEAEPSLWFHEYAHVAMRGPRPTTLVARRIVAAIEEALADCIAAALSQGSVVGGGGPAVPFRDLDTATVLSPAWESLAFAHGFDPHALGAELARALRRLPVADRPVSLVNCLSLARHLDRVRTARDVKAEVLEACPAPIRGDVATALGEWLPAALQ